MSREATAGFHPLMSPAEIFYAQPAEVCHGLPAQWAHHLVTLIYGLV